MKSKTVLKLIWKLPERALNAAQNHFSLIFWLGEFWKKPLVNERQ